MVLTKAESSHGTSKRDDQIQYLESQLQAYKARTSLLQQEHLSLLDTVYEIKQRHKEELEQERKARDLAVFRLQTAKDRLRAVEAERDDYKEVVLQLIERVERSHGDFKHWPYSKLQLSNHVDTLLKEKPVDDRQSAHAYNNGLVHSLKRELYFERQAHALTRARVDILSAQVASRDAALEAWVQHAGSTAAPPAGWISMHDKGKDKSIIQRDLDRSEILALYDQTAANNRLLEQEIHSLFQYVEGTRRNATRLAQHPTSPHPTSPISSPQLIDAFDSDPVVPLSKVVDPVISDGQSNRPVRPVRKDRLVARPQSHISPSPRRGRSLSTSSRQPYKPRPHTRSQSHHHPPTPTSSSLTAFPSENVVQDLSEQIHLLSLQIDGLRVERVALSRVIQSQRDEATVTPDAYQRDSSFDYSETDEDRSFVVDVVDDFERERGSTVVVAEQLDDVQLDQGQGTGVEAVRDEGGDGDVTDGGERSMEIATPLMSTLVTFPVSSGGDDAPHLVEMREPGGKEDQGDDEIKMIRPRRGASVSPPMPS